MSKVPRPLQESGSVRAGLAERILALAIDTLFVSLLVAAIGLALTGITDTRVRVANTVLNVVDCNRRVPVPPGMNVPGVSEVAEARLCTRSAFGFAHDWTLVVSEAAKAGDDAGDRRRTTRPATRAGQPVHAFYLDDTIVGVLGVYLITLQWWFGTTLGKRVVGLHVKSLDGTPPTLLQSAARTVPTLIVLLAFYMSEASSASSLPETYVISFEPLGSRRFPSNGVWTDGLKLIASLYVLGLAIAGYRNKRPLHDEWAGTEVIVARTEP